MNRVFRLPIHWKGYTALVLLVVAVYVYSLGAAHPGSWSLWRLSQDAGNTEQRRLARFNTQDECLKAQSETLDKEFQEQTHVYEALKEMWKSGFPHSPKVFLREGRTIFQLGPSLTSLLFSKLLRDDEKKGLEFLTLPGIESTVSVYCAPSVRYRFWPYYTPKYPAATDDLYTLGQRTLALRAKQMLDEQEQMARPRRP